jgi:hypothetical protein
MKAQHRRRAPYRPRLEFAIGLLALAVCGLGIGLVMADVLEKTPAEVPSQEPTTTTTMIKLEASQMRRVRCAAFDRLDRLNS